MRDKLKSFEEYLKIQKKSQTYMAYLRPFVSFLELESLTFESVDKSIVIKYLSENSKWSAGTTCLFLNAGRQLFKFLDLKNPFLEIELPQTERKIKDFFTLEDIDRAVAYLISESKRTNPLQAKAIFYFLFYTGFRVGEMIGLDRKDFNFDTDPCQVVARDTKTKTDRVGYFPTKEAKIIKAYFDNEPQVQCAFNISYQRVYDMLKKTRPLFPDKHFSPHSFRHGGAKYMFAQGIDLPKISRILGHKKLETTMIYLNPDDKSIQEAYKEKMK
jgi:integrase/recombinase XerD